MDFIVTFVFPFLGVIATIVGAYYAYKAYKKKNSESVTQIVGVGDAIAGDKINGDKVGGDKIVYERKKR